MSTTPESRTGGASSSSTGPERGGAPRIGRSASPSVSTHAALFVVQVAFALGAVEGKIALASGVAPMALAMARMLGATLFFQAVRAVRVGRGASAPRPGWRDLARIAGLSMLGVVLNQGLYLAGLSLSSPVSAALLGATIPVFAAALAVAFRHERLRARTAIGLGCAVAGVVWLTGVRSVDRGALLMAANSFCYALYVVLARRVIQRLGALVVVTWLFASGAVLFSPVGGYALVTGAAEWSARSWGLVAFVVAVPTILAYGANAWALGRAPASLVTVYIYLQPVLTAALAWVQLREPLDARKLLAGGLILLGVGVVAIRPPEPRLQVLRKPASRA